MNNQQAFSSVVSHLAFQKGRSMGTGGCLYRGANNRKCAIGALIPDQLFTGDFDSGSDFENAFGSYCVGHLITRYGPIRELFAGVSTDMLSDLQRMHDDWLLGEDILPKLQDVASRYDLLLDHLDPIVNMDSTGQSRFGGVAE